MNILRGVLSQIIIIPATVVLIVPMMLTALIKLLVPNRRFRRFGTRIVIGIAEIWAWLVVRTFRLVLQTRYEVSGDLDVDRQHSYMLVCNHQSWVDIPVLIEVFDGRAPFYRFFLKQELIWLPLLGMAFWALEYPFMKRYSKAEIRKNPEKQGRDLEATKIACERMRGLPATIINYPEGTRFTWAKHEKQDSPFTNLLRPRAGGISFVLSAMNDQLDGLIDVTIRYPGGKPGFWQFLSNRVPRVQVHVRKLPIPTEMTQGDYQNDPEFRARFQQWVNQLWEEKDQRLEKMKD